MRCCPPDLKLHENKDARMLAAHLQICPWCRADKAEMLPVFCHPEPDVGQVPNKLPRAGELWLVTPELGGWAEKARYYNSPVVLIIDDSDEKMVNVLQIYDDDYLRGQEDVPLGRSPGRKPAGFAEPWNRYSLSKDDLAFRLGEVSPEVLDKCRAATQAPSFAIDQGSLLWFFRNMEVETGFYFARQSIAKVLYDDKTENIREKTARFRSVSAEQVLQQLHHLTLHCKKSLPEDADALDILAYCSVPDESLPLAAADRNKNSFALVFIFGGGRLESYTTSTFKLHQTEIRGNSLLISGTLPNETVDFDEFHCWWERGGMMIPPDKGSSGCVDGVFWAVFSQAEPIKDQEKYEIVIRCIKYL